MRILNSGSIGIGDTTPDYLLDVANTGIDGDIFSLTDSDGECLYNPEAGGVTVSCSSDERLKDNIVDSSSALAYFSNFQIKDYNVIASGDTTTGVIAQELLLSHPELVSLGADGMYKVQMPNQWKLIKAIQELNIKVQGLSSLDTTNSNSLGSLIKSFLADIGNSIDVVFFGEVHTKKLCIEDVCVTKDQLQQMLNNSNANNGGGGSGGGNPPPTPPADVCPNIDGDQAEVPSGYHLEENNCVADTVTPPPTDGDTPPPADGATE
jgi:hypothetical protein